MTLSGESHSRFGWQSEESQLRGWLRQVWPYLALDLACVAIGLYLIRRRK